MDIPDQKYLTDMNVNKLWVLLFIIGIADLKAQNFSEVASNNGIFGGFGFGNVGGGISFADFNQDGWDDLTFGTQEGDSIRFYINERGHFLKIAPLVDIDCQSKSVLWADLDNDGDKDFFASCHDGQNRLFENSGNLNLVDITFQSGITIIDDPSMGASFGDINNDGLLDLYTTAYYDGVFINRLFLNNGDLNFTDITSESGVLKGSQLSFQAAFVDFNNDLLPDIYLANDKDFNNALFKNLGYGNFQDISAVSGAGIVICAMNAGGGDLDNDGDIDLYVTNSPPGNVLLRNNGDETFTDITIAAGVGFYRVGWATSFADVDNDGDLDMYVSAMDALEPNALYMNNGDMTFTEPLRLTGGLGGSDSYYSLCNVAGDFNHDGMMDFAVSNENNHPFNLWKNEIQNDNNWLKIDLEGTSSNRDGIGVWLKAFVGPKTFCRYTLSGEGYLGQGSDFTHFGIADATHVDSLVILWPSGVVDKYYDVAPNHVMHVLEGSSGLTPYPCSVLARIKENQEIDYNYKARQFILSAGKQMNNGVQTLRAQEYLVLQEGTFIEIGKELVIDIDTCDK